MGLYKYSSLAIEEIQLLLSFYIIWFNIKIQKKKKNKKKI